MLAVLGNVVVWIVSTRPPSSKSSSPFSNPLVIVPNAPNCQIIIISIINVILLLREVFTPALADGISLNLSNSKSPQVSRTLLRYDTKQWDTGALSNAEDPHIVITSRSTLARSDSTYLWIK